MTQLYSRIINTVYSQTHTYIYIFNKDVSYYYVSIVDVLIYDYLIIIPIINIFPKHILSGRPDSHSVACGA